jgi:hypothetical protein
MLSGMLPHHAILVEVAFCGDGMRLAMPSYW